MKHNNVKIMPLGGQAEVGKSMYSIEVNGKIFIIDAGYRFPEVDKLGVDVIIPNFDYLKDNKNFIKSYYNANKLDISENVDDKTFEKINNFIESGILINE